MISDGAILSLDLSFGNWRYTNMFTYPYSLVSHKFIIIGLVAGSTLKLINDTKIKIFWNVIFKIRSVT